MRRLALQFGIKQERARWSAVTRETQLLAEAQDLLGKLAWPSMERIEEMSGEYWQLKDLDERQAAMVAVSERLEVENDEAQDRLYSIEEEAEKDIDAIQGRRTELMEKAAEIMDGVEEVKHRDAAVQEVLRPFRPIVGRIKDLRASIRYNQRLARRIAR